MSDAQETASLAVPATGQAGQWFLGLLTPHSPAHNLCAVYRISGELDLPALGAAWRELNHRHDTLRTTLVTAQGQPVRRIVAREAALSFVDFAGAPNAEARAERLCAEGVATGFDLDEGPLARLTVARVAAGSHRLVIVAHRAAVDHRSLGVLIEELSTLYAAALAGRPVRDALPVVAVTYSDWSRQQGEPALAEETGSSLDWWTSVLTPPPPDPTLPADRIRTEAPADAGGSVRFDWGVDLGRAVAGLARAEDTTPSTVLLTAFQTLLFRYGAEDRVTVAAPVRRPSGEGIIGPCETTLVLCTDLSGTPTFREALNRVRRVYDDALEHRELAFDGVVRALNPHRDPRRVPLCDVVFEVHDVPEPPLVLPGADVRREDVHPGAVRADLALSLDRVGPSPVGALEYRDSLFEPATARLVLDQLHTLLAAALAEPDSAVDALPLDGADRLGAASVDADRIAAGVAGTRTVQELVRGWAERRPGVVAVDWRGERMTYPDLVAEADLIAHALRALDVRGRAVVVRLPTGPRQFAALLGVLEVGAHLVWFGTADAGERGRAVLDDLRPACLLAEGNAANDDLAIWYRDTLDGRVLDLARLDPTVDAHMNRTPGGPDDWAYVAYTAGSTGRPKGIAQTNGALAQFVTWLGTEFGLGPGSRVAQWVAPEHDPALCEVFATLVSGATLCPVPERFRVNPEKLVDWLAAERITLLQTVPSFARELLRVITGLRATERLAALNQLLLMGEALPGDLVNGLRAALPLTRVANLYGPTETIAATWHEITGPVYGTAPIGRPIPGRHVLVLDDFDRTCPTGVTGNIVIRSPHVAPGYLGNADQAAFLPLRDTDGPLAGCYRTGDLGRRRSDGLLEYRGRKDFQVKLYGTRVELTDIEAALADHETVAECAVVALTDRDGLVNRLVVHVVPRGATGSAEKWRAHLRRRFGRAVLPAVFRIHDGPLPRNVAGKVDRRRLPDPGPLVVQPPRLPQTPVERGMAAIWSELLGTDQIGLEDTFFTAGGHSLLVPVLLHRIREQFGADLSIWDFFAHSSLGGLSTLVEVTDASSHPTKVPPTRWSESR